MPKTKQKRTVEHYYSHMLGEISHITSGSQMRHTPVSKYLRAILILIYIYTNILMHTYTNFCWTRHLEKPLFPQNTVITLLFIFQTYLSNFNDFLSETRLFEACPFDNLLSSAAGVYIFDEVHLQTYVFKYIVESFMNISMFLANFIKITIVNAPVMLNKLSCSDGWMG